VFCFTLEEFLFLSGCLHALFGVQCACKTTVVLPKHIAFVFFCDFLMDYLATGVSLLLIMIVFALAQWLPLHDASICQAIKEGKKRFVFEGQEIRLIPR
jgi:hypothetical protein